jgi:hypothetical protein
VLAGVNIHDDKMHSRVLQHSSLYASLFFSCDLCLRARRIGKLQRGSQRPTPRSCLVVRNAPSGMLLFSISKVVGLLDIITSLQGRLRLPFPPLHSIKPFISAYSQGEVALSSSMLTLLSNSSAMVTATKPGANHPSAANMSRSPRDSKTPGVQIVR